MKHSNDINYITLFAPSGKTIITTSSNHQTIPSSILKNGTNYSQISNISINDKIYINFSFGKSEFSDSAYTNGFVNNQNDPYFYNIIVAFSKRALNQQLIAIVTTFTLIALFTCIAIYYINAFVNAKQQLADKSTATEDKIIKLCNARLGEIRK